MNLLHFSNRLDADRVTIDPAQISLRTKTFWGPTPKSFWFAQGSALKNPGTDFKGRTAYKARVPKSALYDTRKGDPLGFLANWPNANEKAVIKAGYKGVIFTCNQGDEIVVIYWEKIVAKKACV